MGHVITVLLFTLTAPAVAEHPIEWKLRAEPAEVYPGEPVALVLEAVSESNITEFESMPLPGVPELDKTLKGAEKSSFGHVYLEDCRITMTDQKTKKEMAGERGAYNADIGGVIRLSPSTRLGSSGKPQWSFQGAFPLNAWFLSKPFEAGQYRLRVQSVSNLSYHHAFSVETDLRVLPQNPQAHQNRLSELYESRKTIGITATRLFYTARSIYAVPFQIHFLSEPPEWTHRMLLDGLRDAGTAEAVQGMMSFIDRVKGISTRGGDRELDCDVPYAIRTIYAMREHGDTKILELTEEFVKTHPCPPPPEEPTGG